MTALDAPTGHDDWESHWGAYAEAAEKNPAQAYRRALTLELVGARGVPERLLDIGSGQGDFLRDAHARWPTSALTGLELSSSGIRESRLKVPAARFVQRDLIDDGSPLEPELRHWATHAVCSEVLEHLDDPIAFLANARSYLATDCRLVVTVPGGPRSAFDRHIGHRRHYDRSTLTCMLQDAGFDVEQVLAAGFPAFNLYKLVVIARGKRLIGDADESDGNARLARVAMAAFGPLFRLAHPNSRWGWQLLAVATPN